MRQRHVVMIAAFVAAAAAALLLRDSHTSSAIENPQTTSTAEQTEPTARNGFVHVDATSRTLAGSVVSASGERLANAKVTVLRGARTITEAVTDSQGRFEIYAPAGPYTVSAARDGFGSATIYTVAPTLDLKITLFPGSLVAGRVVLQDSETPVPNAQVIALNRSDRHSAYSGGVEAKSDQQGQFRFENLAAGEWLLSVEGPGVYGNLNEPVRVTVADEIAHLKILVRPAQAVSGRFTIGDTDLACSSGAIRFLPELIELRSRLRPGSTESARPIESAPPGASASLETKIASDGKFRMNALPFGNYMLDAHCDEHTLASGPISLRVTDQPVPELRYNFVGGLGIVATIQDESGQPVPYAEVIIASQDEVLPTRSNSPEMLRRGLTDDRGVYRFGGLPPGRYRVTARYTAINGKASAEQAVTLADGVEFEHVNLTLPGGGVIRIHAHAPTGEAVSRILFFALDGKLSRYEAKYRGDGRFEIGPVPRESYRVFAYDNKNAKIPIGGGAPIPVQATDGVDLDFAYVPPNGRIEGRIVDAAGAPAPGAMVRAVSTTLDETDELYSFIQVGAQGAQELVTDANGRFRIEGLNPQTSYDLYVDHRNGLQDVRRNVAADGFVEIALPAMAAIGGTLVDATGESVESFSVTIENISRGTSRSYDFENSRGQLRMTDLFPGELRIAIFESNGEVQLERTVSLAPGAMLQLGLLVFNTAPTRR